MNLRFCLKDSIYACHMKITDACETRDIVLHVYDGESIADDHTDIEICGDWLEISVIPQMEEYRSAIEEIETKGLGEKLAKKFATFALNTMEKDVLRVGCRYRAENLKDGDTVTVSLQSYAFGNGVSEWLFEFLPVMYMFFEVSIGDCRLEPLDAFGINRKQVLKFNRGLTALNFGLHLIVTYPVQMSRVRALTRNGKIRRTLRRFHFMSEEKRQKILAKFEK